MSRRKIIIIVAVVILATAGWLLTPNSRARTRLERTRRELREQGFKLEFSEIDLVTTADMDARAATLLTFGQGLTGLGLRELDLMQVQGSNSALVTWTQEKLRTETLPDLWPTLRSELSDRSLVLDQCCAAILSGPIRFQPPLTPGGSPPFSYLGSIRSLAMCLAARTILALHGQQQDQAWTNLLALTRLVTAWRIEPSEGSYITRFACVAIAERATWEALQSRAWGDAQLAQLQQEWDGASLLDGLPETAAFARASASEQCRALREQAPATPIPPMQIAMDFASSPNRGWLEMTAGWRDSRYRKYGVYEEENELLLFLRDRELMLRRAMACKTWSEMRAVPGATNLVQSVPNLRVQIMGNFQRGGGFLRAGLPVVQRAADAEARRRLTIVALVIERYRLSQGAYPNSLTQLVPGRLRAVPNDFMDGQPLHYRRVDERHFLLYSVGLDCIDDGGQMRREDDFGFRTNRANVSVRPGFGFGPFRREGPDIIWPIPIKN